MQIISDIEIDNDFNKAGMLSKTVIKEWGRGGDISFNWCFPKLFQNAPFSGIKMFAKEYGIYCENIPSESVIINIDKIIVHAKELAKIRSPPKEYHIDI